MALSFLSLPVVGFFGGALVYLLYIFLKARATQYAITDRRILVCVTAPFSSIKSYGPSLIRIIDIKEKNDHSGTVMFTRELRISTGKHGTVKDWVDIGFHAIPEVRKVARLIEQYAEGLQ